MAQPLTSSLVVSCLFAFVSSPSSAAMYSNDQFDFTVDLPPAMHVCLNEAPSPNHGFAALFNSENCDDALNQPRLELFAEYNIPEEAQSAEELVADICDGSLKATPWKHHGDDEVYACPSATTGSFSKKTLFLLHKIKDVDPSSWVVLQVSLYGKPDSSLHTQLPEEIITSIQWGKSK